MPSGIGQTHIMVCRITSTAYRVGGVRALASPALAVRRKVGCSLNNYWTSHLGGAGEPSGATRRPRGRPWRPPECPDVHGRLRRQSPRGKRINAARSAHVPENYPSASPMVPMRLGHSSSKATASPAKLLAPADDPFRAAVSVDTGFSARHVVHVAHGEHGAASGAF